MAENITVLDNYITTAQASKLFGRTEMTIYLWRKHKGMPVVLIPSDQTPAIRFDLGSVLKWAKEWHFKPIKEQLHALRRRNRKLASA